MVLGHRVVPRRLSLWLSQLREAAIRMQGSGPQPATVPPPGGGAGAEPRARTRPAGSEAGAKPYTGLRPGPRGRGSWGPGGRQVRGCECACVRACACISARTFWMCECARVCARVCVCVCRVAPSCPCSAGPSPTRFPGGAAAGGRRSLSAAQARGQAYCQKHILHCDIL